MCDGLKHLVDLHSCVGNLLRMPQAQAGLRRNRGERWLAEELEGFVRFLDVCSTTRDVLCSVNERTRDLQSALRTKKLGGPAVLKRASNYLSCRRNLRKDLNECFKVVKLMEGRSELYTQLENLEEKEDLTLIASALKEARAVTVSICRTILTFLSSKSRSSDGGWSIISKALLGRGASRRHFPPTEMEKADASILALCNNNFANVENLRSQLAGLEDGIRGLELGLESLFQELIRNRVSLLNIVNM